MKQSEQKVFEKSAGRLDIFFNLLEKLVLVTGAVLLVVTVVLMFKGSGAVGEQGPDALDLGMIKLSLLPAFGIGKMAAGKYLIMTCPVICVQMVFLYAGLRMVRGILKPMKLGRPFEREVSVNLKRMGILILAGGVVLSVSRLYIQNILFREYELGRLFDSQYVSGYSIKLDMNLSFVIAALMLFLLSYVFRYGEKLQIESDETL